ncbi:hypothetical protein BU17DRAFT_72332 [Hysterangium stoloniferum]|nr:hypothetical protein BU17DRAFT_72332 [Hysterangium stoloniferum]
MSDHEVVLSHPDQVEVLPPLISPDALESKRVTVLEKRVTVSVTIDQVTSMQSITKDAFDSWVQQLCRGFATCLEQPRAATWLAGFIRNWSSNSTPVIFVVWQWSGSGQSYCTAPRYPFWLGSASSTHGMWRSTKGGLVVRLTDTGEGGKTRNRLLKKQLTMGQLSIIVKEGVDLLRHVRFW